jgi:hypothetical protein
VCPSYIKDAQFLKVKDQTVVAYPAETAYKKPVSSASRKAQI